MDKDLRSQVSPARTIHKQGTRSPFKVAVLAAALTAGMLMSVSSHAFSLGNLSALSALGEPLRLEFEVLELSPAEMDSLKVTLESPQSYAARGLGYGPALEGMRLGLVRNAAGRFVIRMEGQRPATDAFVDLLLNISWASGSTIRSVSLLLTPPPGMASAESPVPSPAPMQPSIAAATAGGSGIAPDQSAAPASNSTEASKIVAKPGDTAGALAQRERPAGVDQNQYLLALVQTNPSAFIEGNVNRLLAGAELQLPTEARAQVTRAPEARQIISAQWQAFQALRQQIAAKKLAIQPPLTPSVPSAPAAQAQGQVDTLQAASPSPADKLTLSKPSTAGDGRADQAMLDEREANEAKARLEELTRTARELNQLQANAGGSNNEVAAVPASAATTPEANAKSGDEPIAAVTAVAVPAPASEPIARAGLIDRLADHPAVLPAAGGSLAIALAWLGWRLRRKSSGSGSGLEGELEAELVSTRPTNSTSGQVQPEQLFNKKAKANLDLDLELDLDEDPAVPNTSSLTAQARARAKQASST